MTPKKLYKVKSFFPPFLNFYLHFTTAQNMDAFAEPVLLVVLMGGGCAEVFVVSWWGRRLRARGLLMELEDEMRLQGLCVCS